MASIRSAAGSEEDVGELFSDCFWEIKGYKQVLVVLFMHYYAPSIFSGIVLILDQYLKYQPPPRVFFFSHLEVSAYKTVMSFLPTKTNYALVFCPGYDYTNTTRHNTISKYRERFL